MVQGRRHELEPCQVRFFPQVKLSPLLGTFPRPLGGQIAAAEPQASLYLAAIEIPAHIARDGRSTPARGGGALWRGTVHLVCRAPGCRRRDRRRAGSAFRRGGLAGAPRADLFAFVSLAGAKSNARWLSPIVPLGLILMFLGTLGFIHLFADGQRAAEAGEGGGYLGLALSTLLSTYLTSIGAGVVLFAVALLGFMLAFGVSLAQLVRGVGGPTVAAGRMAGKVFGEAGNEVSRLLSEKESRRGMPQEPVRINGRPALDDTALYPSSRAAGKNSSLEDLPINLPTDSSASHSAPTEVVKVVGLAEEAPKNGKVKPEPVINELRLKNGKPATDEQNAAEMATVSPLGYIWNLPPVNLAGSYGRGQGEPGRPQDQDQGH